jgi:type IV pilus assembly protein PilN
MIRINLLQVKATRERKRASGAAQSLIFAGLVAAEVVCIVIAQMHVSGKLKEKQREVDEVRQQLTLTQGQITGIDEKKAELDRIQKKKEVIKDLQAAQTGPKFMLFEVMKILSKAGGPTKSPETVRMLTQSDRGEGFNRAWDYRKLWLTKFEEEDREVTIDGGAMDVEDISEFQRRLNLSQYFRDVRWVRSPEDQTQPGEETTYAFTLKAQVRYR